MNRLSLFLGGCAITVLGSLAYFLADDGNSRKRLLRRDRLIEILKELQRETYSALITLASFAISIKEQAECRIRDCELREVLYNQSPFKRKIERAAKKVYEHFETTEAEVQAAFEHYKNDKEVAGLIEEMKQALDDAYQGKPPQTYCALPSFVTPEFTLQVMASVCNKMKEIAYKKLTLLRAEGINPSPYDARFMRATKEIEAEFEDAKESVYIQAGLGRCQDLPTVTVHNAIVKFSHEVPGFSGKLDAIESEHRKFIQQMMQGQSCLRTK